MGFYVGGPVGENTGTLARAPLVADPVPVSQKRGVSRQAGLTRLVLSLAEWN